MSAMVRRVLIVDDHHVVRRGLRLAFESKGFTCGEAENGAEAVEQAEQVQPDLIVLDLSMSVMNGLQAAPLLKRRLPQTQIILLTMHATNQLGQILPAGISAVISKDDTIANLLNTALRLLG